MLNLLGKDKISFLVPFLASGLGLNFLYNYALFKNPLRFPQEFYINGIHFYYSGLASHVLFNLVSPYRGILLYSPILILGFYGLYRLSQSTGFRADAFLFLTLFAAILSILFELAGLGRRKFLRAEISNSGNSLSRHTSQCIPVRESKSHLAIDLPISLRFQLLYSRDRRHIQFFSAEFPRCIQLRTIILQSVSSSTGKIRSMVVTVVSPFRTADGRNCPCFESLSLSGSLHFG